MRVVAHRGPSRQGLKLGAAFAALCLISGAVASTLLSPQAAKLAPAIFGMLGFLGFAAGAASGMVARTVEIEIQPTALRVLDHPPEQWSPRGATIGPLYGQHGGGSGTVVHLVDGPRVLRVAAMGARTIDAAQATAPPVTLADLYVAPAELDAIRAWAQQPALTAPGGSSRFRLVQNPLLIRSTLRMVLPFVGAVALMAIIARLLEPLGWLRSDAGQGVFGFLALLIMGALFAWTLLRRANASAGLLLEVGPAGLRLLDGPGKRVLGQASPGALELSRAMHSYVTRTGTFEYPSLTLRWAGQPPLAVGVVGLHLRWADVTQHSRAPQHVLGLPDFLALVDALGLRPTLLGA